jgi:hypothetical protein
MVCAIPVDVVDSEKLECGFTTTRASVSVLLNNESPQVASPELTCSHIPGGVCPPALPLLGDNDSLLLVGKLVPFASLAAHLTQLAQLELA